MVTDVGVALCVVWAEELLVVDPRWLTGDVFTSATGRQVREGAKANTLQGVHGVLARYTGRWPKHLAVQQAHVPPQREADEASQGEE